MMTVVHKKRQESHKMAQGRDKTGRVLDKKARELRTMMLARHRRRSELHKTPQERDKKIQGPHMLMQGPHKKPLGHDRQVMEPHRRPPHGRLGEHHNQ